VFLKLFALTTVVTLITAEAAATVTGDTVLFVPTLLSLTLFNLLPPPSSTTAGPVIRSYII
jgi:hypothetical protein